MNIWRPKSAHGRLSSARVGRTIDDWSRVWYKEVRPRSSAWLSNIKGSISPMSGVNSCFPRKQLHHGCELCRRAQHNHRSPQLALLPSFKNYTSIGGFGSNILGLIGTQLYSERLTSIWCDNQRHEYLISVFGRKTNTKADGYHRPAVVWSRALPTFVVALCHNVFDKQYPVTCCVCHFIKYLFIHM